MTKKKENLTLLSAFEAIWEKTEKSQLSAGFFKKIKPYTDFVGEKLSLTPMQCVIVSVLMDIDDCLVTKQLARFAATSNIKVLTYEDDFRGLVQRGIATRDTTYMLGEKHTGYRIVPKFVSAVKNNTVFEAKNIGEYTAEEALETINKWLKVAADEASYEMAVNAICEILDGAKHLQFVQKLNALSLRCHEMMLLLIAACDNLLRGNIMVDESDYRDILCNDDCSLMLFTADLDAEENVLMQEGLLELYCNDGEAVPGKYMLADKARNEVFAEFKSRRKRKAALASGLLQPESIAAKTLYYNDRERAQVERLTQLLDKEHFACIQQRLKEENMRPGFACLFYGCPGTGKTETVLQLSRATGRPVMQVNVSELKSKWVGESEKLVQGLFDNYAQMCKECELCPILLFNEADAILGRRTTNAEHSVDKMENAIQNILLQAIENLDGILIATTNLTENLDDAFERRFLYKIRFDKPTEGVKARIWKNMLPSLSDNDAEVVAGYDFSGGQIENVARKARVDSLLYGTAIGVDQVRGYCEEERIMNKGKRTPIGFCA